MKEYIENLIELYKKEDYPKFDKELSYFANQIFKKPKYKEDSFYFESAKNIFIGIIYAMMSKKMYDEINECNFKELIKPEKIENLLSGLGKNNIATINAGWYLDKPEYIQKLIQKEYENSIVKIKKSSKNDDIENIKQIKKIILSTIKKLPKIRSNEKLQDQFVILNECQNMLMMLKNDENTKEVIEELNSYILDGISYIESALKEEEKHLPL